MVKFGIGQAITRREDDRLLTGKACYVDDVRMPGALHAMFVRSPHAHARVTAIDVSEALATAGVVAVLTGADLKADGVGAFPPNPMLKPDAAKSVKVSFPALAIDVVRFVGQPVAVVLAESRAAAEVAVNLVQVDYDALSCRRKPRRSARAISAMRVAGRQEQRGRQGDLWRSCGLRKGIRRSCASRCHHDR